MKTKKWREQNISGQKRVIVTKELPGNRWLEVLTEADCKIEIYTSNNILTTNEIRDAIGDRCDGAIGQLTEDWNRKLFASLKMAGCKVYSNYAVGYDNVDVTAATDNGIAVGNTPGVLTETTAEMAVALTFAAARRVVEADRFMRSGKYRGWLPTLFLGKLLFRKTLGVIGAGRIGATYARMMIEGFKMNLIYYDVHRNMDLENYVAAYGKFLKSCDQESLTCMYAKSIEDVLREADVVSLHTTLNESTYHMIYKDRLNIMKKNAIMINTSRGPIIDEKALVNHCIQNPGFRVGLDVYEDEPNMKQGLKTLDNAVIVPHIASATSWTRQGMAILAASNVAAILMGYPVWPKTKEILPFLEPNPPKAVPSIVNMKELSLPLYT